MKKESQLPAIMVGARDDHNEWVWGFLPFTLMGRGIAFALVVRGIAILGVVTATLAFWLIEQVGQRAGIEAEIGEVPVRAELAEMNQKIDRLTVLLEKLSNHPGSYL
jgi:voltage-gated potassium channel